jgi:hypothetical protein
MEEKLLQALQQIATGEIVGEPKNYKDSLYIVREIAKDAIEDYLKIKQGIMKQTAVEWLAEQMEHPHIFNPLIEKALQMEKQERKQLGQITEKGIIDTIGNCANCGVEFHIHKNIEEPKQETLEEAAQRVFDGFADITKPSAVRRALELVKWQQEQDKNKYSLDDLKEAFVMGRTNAKIKDFNTKFKKK